MTESVASRQEGCRWIDNPPTGAEFATWFEANVPLHDGMKHSDYVNGIALIPNMEKVRFTTLDGQGNQVVEERERLVFSPYPQVETRVRYFWDWCRRNDYLGEIAPVRPGKQPDGLPEGVFTTRMPDGRGAEVILLCASYQVGVFVRDEKIRGGKGAPVMQPPLGSKHVKALGKFGPDVNASMRAQTGAIGRALGFAGMLVVPGAGVSSAEDMIDLATAEPTIPSPPPVDAPVSVAGPELAAQEPTNPVTAPAPMYAEADMEAVVKQLLGELAQNESADKEFRAWAAERGLDLESPAPASLRTLEKRLRQKLELASR